MNFPGALAGRCSHLSSLSKTVGPLPPPPIFSRLKRTHALLSCLRIDCQEHQTDHRLCCTANWRAEPPNLTDDKGEQTLHRALAIGIQIYKITSWASWSLKLYTLFFPFLWTYSQMVSDEQLRALGSMSTVLFFGDLKVWWWSWSHAQIAENAVKNKGRDLHNVCGMQVFIWVEAEGRCPSQKPALGHHERGDSWSPGL